MWVKRKGKFVKISRKSIGLRSSSATARKREAFERKKMTKTFRAWRLNQYRVVQHGLCYYCKRPIKGALVTDHVIPISRGGSSSYSNLVVTDWECNDKKGIKIIPKT